MKSYRARIEMDGYDMDVFFSKKDFVEILGELEKYHGTASNAFRAVVRFE